MGLAISAASLATLRPLLALATWKLGLGSTEGSSLTRSYKLPSGSMANGNIRLDRNIYIMSEFSQGRSSAKKGEAAWDLGTHTMAYAEPAKNMSTESAKETDFDNSSQEQLRERPRGD